ncbi:cell wall-binding repeat-containing protein [Guptibacillus spartinae]|uniref:cell wall-binding repeat-containing protein n=1 Tax=Guptibacillus spartinae TaxID=3025679 RepID=UPI0023629275|nr:cell wall-binding repeat-containing protein [Pseudalkalibacillus spartinae]
MKRFGKRKISPLLLLILVITMLMPSQAFAIASVDDEKNAVHYAAFGDSLAAGVLSDNTIGLSYTDYIAQDLQRVDLLGSYEKPYAVPGATSQDMLDALMDRDMQIKIASKDMITITIGANDFLQVLSKEPERLQNPEEVKKIIADLSENYVSIMTIVRSVNPSAEIYLMGYYNGFYAFPEAQQRPLVEIMQTVNSIIKQIASDSNSHYVPTYDAISTDPLTYLPNSKNVHPSPAGYMAIADEFWEQVKLNLPTNVTRIAGVNRYETAVKISQEGWKEHAQGVVIARGDDFPDALAGAPLAYDLDSPILLTHSKALDPIVKEEIERLHPEFAILLGGEKALSKDVEDELGKMGIPVERIAGDNRYETAAKIAGTLPHSDKAVIANGTKFPDALAIASYASENTYPILLTKQDEIPEDTAEVLKRYPESIAVGGTAVLSESLVEKLPKAKRYGGEDRYETASIIAMELNPSHKAFVSTGLEFADALTGSVLAAKRDNSFLLVDPNKMQDAVLDAKENLEIYHFTILGGPKAVSPTIEKQLIGVK